MKKLICIALALVMVLGLAVTVSAEGPRVTLTYAEVNPIEGTIVGMIATYFKEQVETLINGSVCIDIQANGVLGNEASVLPSPAGSAPRIDHRIGWPRTTPPDDKLWLPRSRGRGIFCSVHGAGRATHIPPGFLKRWGTPQDSRQSRR